jgi:hypothetical protein
MGGDRCRCLIVRLPSKRDSFGGRERLRRWRRHRDDGEIDSLGVHVPQPLLTKVGETPFPLASVEQLQSLVQATRRQSLERGNELWRPPVLLKRDDSRRAADAWRCHSSISGRIGRSRIRRPVA